jgi:hypothetical protein
MQRPYYLLFVDGLYPGSMPEKQQHPEINQK